MRSIHRMQRTMFARTIRTIRVVLGAAVLGWLGLASAVCAFQATEGASAPAGRASKRAVLPPQVEKIDKAMESAWADAKIKPSAVEDEIKWCRRVYLDLIGRIPSFEEFSEFAKDKSPD